MSWNDLIAWIGWNTRDVSQGNGQGVSNDSCVGGLTVLVMMMTTVKATHGCVIPAPLRMCVT